MLPAPRARRLQDFLTSGKTPTQTPHPEEAKAEYAQLQ